MRAVSLTETRAGNSTVREMVARREPLLRVLSHVLDGLGDRVVLFRHGHLLFVTFGFFAALGALVSIAGMGVILTGQGLRPDHFLAIVLAASGAVVVVSWVVGQMLDYRLVMRDPLQALRRPVFASWGGVFALPFVFALSAWPEPLVFLLLVDAAARSVPLGHALGRLGCLSYGCCFGRPTHGSLSITYRNPESKAVRVGGLHGVPLHPAALYEAGVEVGVFLAANAAYLLGAPLGVPAALALVLYGSGRFAIEFLRDNDGRQLFGPFAVNHMLALGLVAIGTAALAAIGLWSPAPGAFSWASAFGAASRLLPTAAAGALVVFLGFSVHRQRVGHW